MKSTSFLFSLVFISATLSHGWHRDTTAAGAPPQSPKDASPGLITNQSADSFFATRPAEDMTIEGLYELIDQYVGTQVSHVFFNPNYMRVNYPSHVWDSFLDSPAPPADSRWVRNIQILDKKGIDPYRVWITRCREKGLSPWLSMRMNDGHYIDDPGRVSKLWLNHPEYRRIPAGTFDYGVQAVRDHHMALIREYLERYDADGLELDWMRFPQNFKPGQEKQGGELLTQFMQQVRELTEQWSAKRGHAIKLAVRVPAVPETARAWGLDGVAWARAGLIDVLIPTPIWQPVDFDIPIDRWRELVGSETMGKITLAAGMELSIRGYPGGELIFNNPETMRGFTASMLDRGADQIYLFNHFDNWPEYGGTMAEYRTILSEGARMETVIDKPRRHIVTYRDLAPPGKPAAHRALPAIVSEAASAEFRIHTGPKPSSGRVLVRIGLADGLDARQDRLQTRVNGVECRRIADFNLSANPKPPVSRTKLPPREFGSTPARVAQFKVPLTAMRRGYNTVKVSLNGNADRKIVWMEIYIIP